MPAKPLKGDPFARCIIDMNHRSGAPGPNMLQHWLRLSPSHGDCVWYIPGTALFGDLSTSSERHRDAPGARDLRGLRHHVVRDDLYHILSLLQIG